MKNTASKEKTPITKVDLVSGLVAGFITGLAGGAASGCEGIEKTAALGFAIAVCLLVSIIKPYKAIAKKLFNNDKVDIDEDDHIGRIITSALASVFCSVIITIGLVSVITAIRDVSIDSIVDAYEEQITLVQGQIDVLSAENESIYQDFCLVSDFVDKNKEEIEGYDNRIKELEAQKKGFEDEIITYTAEVNVINNKIEEKKEEEGPKVEKWRNEQQVRLDELDSQIKATVDGVTEVDARISELELKKSTANKILDTNSAAMEEKWNIYSDKLIIIQSLQDNMNNLCSEQLKYYYSKPTFEGLFGKVFIACFIAGLAAFAGVIYLRDPVTEKLEEIKAAKEDALKRQEEEKEEAERKAREADEAVITELKEKRQQHLMSQNESDDTSSEV